ncbi:MAG: hypothetical protein HWE08_04845 [Alphaproteobacteria bacterium]|nr:hypothetical protein [Alphaproteobacteria bacterium]
MKQLLACATAVFLLAGTLHAAPLPKPFEEMTLEELRAVETDGLTKEQKKHHKKILKAAKKAEKARLKAEKKRRKAEAKAIRKHNKKVDKLLGRIEKTFLRSTIYRDDFEAYTRITGPYDTNSPTLFGANDYLIAQRFWLESYYDPASDEIPIRLYISDKIEVDELNDQSIQSIKGPPERYVGRHHGWNNFVRATLRGGAIRQLQPSKRYLDTCTVIKCYFREEFYIELDDDDLLDALLRVETLDIKISDPSGEHYIFSLPAAYTIGFFKRFGDLQPGGEMVRDAVIQLEESIRGWKKPLPAE